MGIGAIHFKNFNYGTTIEVAGGQVLDEGS
jgi:hypothetical protein